MRRLALAILLAASQARSATGEGPGTRAASPEVRQMVLAKLMEPTQAEIEHLKQVVRAIASEEESRRGPAEKEFAANLVRYYFVLMGISREDLALSPEEVARLGKRFGAPGMRELQRKWYETWRIVEAEGLVERPEFLIALLARSRDAEQAAVAKQLRRVTRQDFADDAEAWKRWWAAAQPWGKLDRVAPETGDLMRLRLAHGDRLRLDRDHWKVVADKTDIEKLRKRVEAAIYQGTRNREHAAKRSRAVTPSPAYGLVLTKLELAGGILGHGRRTRGSDYIRLRFHGSGLRGRLLRRGERMEITLEETWRPFRYVQLTDDGGGRLRLILAGLGDGSAVLLEQGSDGQLCVGQADAAGTSLFRARSFASFCRSHRAAAADISARLRRLGIALPKIEPGGEAAGGRAAAAAPPGESGREHWQDGALQEIPADVARLIGLGVGPKGLCVDRGHWGRGVEGLDLERLQKDEDGHRVFDERWFAGRPADKAKLWREAMLAMAALRAACRQRWGGGGGGTGFGEHMEADYSFSNGFAAALRIEGGRVDISLTEERDPARLVRVVDDARGGLRILVLRSTDESFLLVHQGRSGRCCIAQAGPDGFYLVGEPSFKALCRRWPRFVEGRVLGYLKHVGMVTPPSPLSEEVVDAVLAKLEAAPERDAGEARRLIQQLDDDSYRRREDATVLLTRRFLRYRKALEEARKDAGLPPETRNRLQRVFADALSPVRIEQVVSGMRLLDDVDYLIDLLARPGIRHPKVLAARLRTLTGKDLGDDPDAWRRRRPGALPKP